MKDKEFLFSVLQRIKRKLGGEEGRCRCYERRRTKVCGNRSLSHQVDLSWTTYIRQSLSLVSYTLRYVSLEYFFCLL